MAIEKAKEFLKELAQNKELQEKMSGFTLDELKQAGAEMRSSGELSDEDLKSAAGGTVTNISI